MNIKELHERILYPVVRVRTGKAGGSGTVIYSKDKGNGEHQTFVMTNWHVIADAITIKDEWDSLLKKERKQDFMEQVGVEIFDYINLSTISSSNSYRADIIAYDQQHDLAVLKLTSPKPIEHVVTLIPRDQIAYTVKLFLPTRSCGCSLGHEPFSTTGEITGLTEIIEQREYYMVSHSSIFGNSGGGVFNGETGDQIGVTARITTIQLGFGVDVVTWMGFCVSAPRIYQYLDEQELRFLYDPNDNFEDAMARREKKQRDMILRALERSESSSSSADDNM